MQQQRIFFLAAIGWAVTKVKSLFGSLLKIIILININRKKKRLVAIILFKNAFNCSDDPIEISSLIDKICLISPVYLILTPIDYFGMLGQV